MNAEQIAKEISDEFDAATCKWMTGATKAKLRAIIGERIKPLVEDAERWKRECDSVRSLANKLDARADDADRYELWLLDIGRAIGCQHLDEQLPNCVIQHLQGDQESEATNAPNPAN